MPWRVRAAVPMRHRRVMLMGALIALPALAACTGNSRLVGPRPPAEKPTPAPPSPQDNPLRPAKTDVPEQPETPRVMRTIGFEVLKLELPLGAASTSDTLWNQVRDDAVGADKMLLLRQNGFRIGVGRRESWPPIKAILDNIPGPVRHTPYNVGFAPDQREDEFQTRVGIENLAVFYFDGEGRAIGWTLVKCGTLFRARSVIDPQFPDDVTVQIVPEVRQEEPQIAFDIETRKIRRINEIKPLWDLAVRVRLSEDQFLLIGASSKALAGDSLVGRRFMIDERDGRPIEYLFVLFPQVHRVTIGPK